MKSFLPIFLFAILSTSFIAQDAYKYSFETQFDVFTKTSNAGNNLKFRFFINEQNAIRTNWQFKYQNNQQEILEIDGDGVGTLETVSSANQIFLGYERHLKTDRFSPYLGASVGFGFGKDEVYGSRTDGVTFINDFNYSQKQPFTQFCVHAFTGFDFDIYKGLFVGTEIGYKVLNTKYKRGETVTEDASSTTDATTTTPIPEKKSTSFFLANMGVIRVGWKF